MTVQPSIGDMIRRLIEELKRGVEERFRTADGRELSQWYVLSTCDAYEFSAYVTPGGRVVIDVVGCAGRHRIRAVLRDGRLRVRGIRSYAR